MPTYRELASDVKKEVRGLAARLASYDTHRRNVLAIPETIKDLQALDADNEIILKLSREGLAQAPSDRKAAWAELANAITSLDNTLKMPGVVGDRAINAHLDSLRKLLAQITRAADKI